jgi:hypothetical protein
VVAVTFTSADAPDAVYGRLDGDAAIFAAPASLRAALTPWLLDRHALVCDPALVRAIVVGGKSKDPRDLDEAGVPLVDDLAAVLTDTVHLGPARRDEGFDPPREVRVRLAPDAGRADVTFAAGASSTRAGRRVRFVRVPGIDATLAVPEAALARVLSPP